MHQRRKLYQLKKLLVFLYKCDHEQRSPCVVRHKNGTDGGGLATRQIVNAEYQIPDTKSEAAATVADLLMIAVCFCLRCVNAEKPH